jgi:hypothetical protein
MRFGTGNALRLALLASVIAGAAAVPATASAATSTALERVDGPGTFAAAPLDIFTLAGAPEPNRIGANLDPATGRLVLTSPEGIMAPATPRGECRQDAATQVSCDPGYVDAITGDLGGGADSFTAGPGLPVSIGSTWPARSGHCWVGADAIGSSAGAPTTSSWAGRELTSSMAPAAPTSSVARAGPTSSRAGRRRTCSQGARAPTS